MNKVLFLVCLMLLGFSQMCIAQNNNNFRLEMVKFGFTSVPQYAKVGDTSFVMYPLFVAAPVIFNKGIVTVPFYDHSNKSVGLFTGYDIFETKKDSLTVSLYNVVGKGLTDKSGIVTFGLQLTPKKINWVSPFLEGGLIINSNGTKTFGIFSGFFFTAAQVPIWKRKN